MLRLNVLLDRPGPGSWNMAVDEALLEQAEAGQGPTLRFYQWNEPTVSLGYFQAHRDRAGHRASAACPLVRRASGGGALIHDQELTYSFTAAVADRLASDVEQLYYAFHETAAAVLGQWNVAAALSPGSPAGTGDRQPFLCFQRRTRGDLLVGSAKVLGSAQRRRRGAVLQHGGVLLSRSAAAPELPGIEQLSGQRIEPRQFIERWLPLLEERLQAACRVSRLSAETAARASEIEREKFAADRWTMRR